jgi:hypothetical protein
VSKASDVIVRPVNAATVTVGKVTLSGADKHIRFSGQGATLNVKGVANGNGDAPAFITFDHVNFTDCVNFWVDGTSTANVFDHDRFEGLGPSLAQCKIQPDDRAAWEVSDFDVDPTGTAVTLSNSLIKDGCGDGIHLRSPGVVVGPGTVITGRHYNNCTDGTHVDGIQCGGARGFVLKDSYLYANSANLQCGAGGGAEHNITAYNNVFGPTDSTYTSHYWACACGGNVDDHFEHNYMDGGVCIGLDTGHAPSGDIITNNVWNAGTGGVGTGCQDSGDNYPCPGCVASYNLNPGTETEFNGNNSRTESPVKLVSASPTTYYDYMLDPSSTGYNTASDGKPMGICSTCG